MTRQGCRFGPLSLAIAALIAIALSSCGASRKSLTDTSEQHTSSPKEVVKSPAGESVKPETKPETAKPESASNELFSFCESWKGTPYKYGGCTKSGTDCSGFAGQLYKEVYGVSLPRSSSDMAKICIRVDENDLREGDLVFFKINGKTISHVGVFLGDGNFIHASTKRGVIISNLNEEYYRRTFAQGGRF